MTTATQQDTEKFEEYAQPGALVTTQWVEDNLDDIRGDNDDLRIAEVDVDTVAYDQSHIPGAIGWDWESDLCDTVQRDLIPKEELEELLGEAGITNDTTIILYGDNDNWFAAWAFWQLKYYGHDDVRLMDGGRKKWLDENRETTTEQPNFTSRDYTAEEPDESIRTYFADVNEIRKKAAEGKAGLVDVRSEAEFTGEKLAPEGLNETCQRGGHIPGASNIGWGEAVNEDGTFKSADELRDIYGSEGITDDKEIVTYCRIGERSSHSWFVLTQLLGYDDVKNYDGSWTEWGNVVGADIETGK
jgi:thiosulfate/3-mercaptopyruvate sulfurtransferase